MTTKTISFIINNDGTLTKVDRLPKDAIRVHLYNFENILKPRGSMEKESIGMTLYEKFMTAYEDWTDHKYGDRKDPEEVVSKIRDNVVQELEQAFRKFLDDITIKHS